MLLTQASWVGALEPVSVSVEGVARLSEGSRAAVRRLAFRAALTAAVLKVVRQLVPPLILDVEEERIRAALGPRASEFVMTYRVEGSGELRPVAGEPELQELVVRLTARVDASRVRAELENLRVLRSGGAEASVLLSVRHRGLADPEPEVSLAALEHFLARRLRQEGLVVVDPALRGAGAAAGRSALELAQRLGADLAIEVQLHWQRRQVSSRLTSGLLRIELRALRAYDALEVAAARFEAPAHHADPAEAFMRAVEAVQPQVADNLILQLSRNWHALTPDEGEVSLRLLQTTGLAQIGAVQRALRKQLGASRADLVTLVPWSAELFVRSRLSPGALQDRLAAIEFDGFRLTPVAVSRRRVDLRVEPRPADPGPGAPASFADPAR